MANFMFSRVLQLRGPIICVNNIKHQRGGTSVHNVLVKRQQLSEDTEVFRCVSTLRLITTEKKYKRVFGSSSLNRQNLLIQGSSIKFFVTENHCLKFSAPTQYF